MNKREEMHEIIGDLKKGELRAKTISIEELLKCSNTAIVDVRSPQEYQQDHIWGAVNIPVLDDEERALIGTIYKQKGQQEAVEEGIGRTEGKMVYFHRTFQQLAQSYEQVVLYCFRGGMRSQSIAEYMNRYGVPVMKLKGGYKAYRRYVLNFFEEGLKRFTFVVLHGHTGVGKTQLLKELAEMGYDTLDLEYYAKHSGSVFGDLFFKENQPAQKIFESAVFHHLYHSKAKYIFMESESPKIGKVFVPQPFCRKMERERHILVQCSEKKRIERLVRDYTSVKRPDDQMLYSSIRMLQRMIGAEAGTYLETMLDQGNYEEVADYLIRNYYDRFYRFSIEKYEYDKVVCADDIKKALADIEEFCKRKLK